jgi:drug/metabolite transporter (DMT)-like permease
MGAFALMARHETLDGRTLFGLLLGFVGSLMLAQARADLAGAGGLLAGLGAGACLGLFTVCVRPIVREENVLPALALVLGIGAACLLVTCLSRGDAIFKISLGQMGLSALGGLLTVALMFAVWLTCLSGASVSMAAPVWYMGAGFAVFWAWRGPEEVDAWMTLGGVILVVLGLYGAGGKQQDRPSLTFGDILREE